MRFWKVHVRSHRMLDGQIELHHREILLQAENSDQAMRTGERFAESTAAFGADWRQFEATRAATVDLPIDLPVTVTGNETP